MASYEELRDVATVAASQTKLKLGPNGNVGDIIERLIIIPDTTAAGTVTLYDSTGGTGMVLFVTGTLSNLTPITINLGMRSVLGGFLLSTGANVHCIAVGRFT